MCHLRSRMEHGAQKSRHGQGAAERQVTSFSSFFCFETRAMACQNRTTRNNKLLIICEHVFSETSTLAPFSTYEEDIRLMLARIETMMYLGSGHSQKNICLLSERVLRVLVREALKVSLRSPIMSRL